PRHDGNLEAREIIGDGDSNTLERLVDEATATISEAFSVLLGDRTQPSEFAHTVVRLRLSPALEAWRATQLAAGRILPAKGHGLRRVSDTIIKLLGLEDWPEPLLTANILFVVKFNTLLIGGNDPHTLFSNYIVSTAFYLEHGYARAFPSFETLLHDALQDPHALATPVGHDNRAGAIAGARYIRAKCALEERAAGVAVLNHMTARLSSRRAAQVVYYAESSLLGMVAESIARGFDPAAILSDLVFSNSGTDVLDVGSDLVNSELFNSFLNTEDIAGAPDGVLTEAALGRVYDAFAHVGACVLGARWAEPTAQICSQLFNWHTLNGRHFFLRRCVLGTPRCSRRAQGQREADFDEAFDEKLGTTGFSSYRPLETACNGAEPVCDRLEEFLALSPDRKHLIGFWSVVMQPLAYARAGIVDAVWEEGFCEKLGCALAKTYARGLVREISWLTAHASHHCWQINYLMEAAMWGSFLDDGELNGRLDRFEGEKDAA
ncbi:hypothetical protein FB45DRAFT_759471, partial [Roridomyces roridus]